MEDDNKNRWDHRQCKWQSLITLVSALEFVFEGD